MKAKQPHGPAMTLGNVRSLGLAVLISLTLIAEIRAAEAVYLGCSGTLTTSKSQSLPVREEPWTFSLGIGSDKKTVTISDTSMLITSDASETVIAFRDDPAADPLLDKFWGSLNSVTGEVNIHVKDGALFTGTCKPAP
jgi:hypothetical protein